MLNGVLDAVNCCAHAGHLEWVGVEIGFGVEVGARFGVCCIAAVIEDLFQEEWKG